MYNELFVPMAEAFYRQWIIEIEIFPLANLEQLGEIVTITPARLQNL
jgi:hypothetical protein